MSSDDASVAGCRFQSNCKVVRTFPLTHQNADGTTVVVDTGLGPMGTHFAAGKVISQKNGKIAMANTLMGWALIALIDH